METTNKQTGNEVKSTTYECPMHCEKDKVHDHPGNCPVCNMKMVPVGEKNSHGEHHNCC